ncbi:TlpA family protein disulfide reductase [Sphingopyxis sp. OPL5]|uniref:TlpA family protein disulfide reductase n=1 Tax=Sphingopyxis sp. OPL5 TaxID=2486273 RepID=UPI00164D7755|nr:TlpA disulfide reductase family protein [Sphingopyxis sp. OPL5]QNO25538.1 TlpA family protein disulfide reductase [Sphingopyxis sp. OPL5]
MKIIPARLLFAPLAALLLLGASPGKTPTPGFAAPAFTLTTFDKRKVTLAEMKGKVVVINYWATWCAPCKAEMPMMHRYFKANQARGLEMFGVTTEDSVPKAQLKKVSDVLSYPLSNRMTGNYGSIDNAVPSTYIIDRKGIVRHAKKGAYTDREFKAALDPLLAEAP